MNSHQYGQTGPKSITGKRKSSLNALKTGVFAKTPVLPFEDEAQYRRHVKSVMRSLEPEDAVQMNLAQQIADSMWRGQRQELTKKFRHHQRLRIDVRYGPSDQESTRWSSHH